MESAAVLRPLNSTVTRMHLFEGCPIIQTYTAAQKLASNSYIQGLAVGRKFVASPMMHKGTISCAKTPETAVSTKSDVSSESHPKQSLEKHGVHRATFPNGFEALVQEVCDGTEVAELKLKVGDFEMHMKRNVGTKAPMPLISPTTPPPIPTKPMDETASSTPVASLPPKSSEKTSPFANVSMVKASKLASLEASGFNSYVLVSSPTVGSFRRGRTLKGKRQPHTCKEGDVIKEGQVIGYLDQFGTELPVKSDVAGEVLKLLYDDGEAVGYGDPLVAVLPSFHSIKL